MTRDELADALLAAEWREGGASRDYTRMFYKRFDTPTRCRLNDEKPGMQIVIEATALPGYPDMVEIDVAGELADGTWIKVQQWALPMEAEAVLGGIPRLLATWEFIANWEGGRMTRYLFAAKLFLSLVGRCPDSRRVPRAYRAGRISPRTAWQVAAGWLREVA